MFHGFAMEIELLDDKGRILGRAPVGNKDRWIIACSHEQKAVTLQIRPHDGYGSVVLLISRGTLEMGRATRQAIELGENQALDTLVASEHRTLKQLGYPREKQFGQISIERGFQRRFVGNNVRGCTRFDFFAGAPGAGIQARIYAANGNLVASDGGVQHFPLVACISGKFTLVIETFGRGGPVLIEQRQEATVNPIVINFPRATARLFQRAWNLGLANSLSRFTSLESTLLADERVWERNITLDPEQCREYFMALDGDATGIDLRIVDIESEEIISGEQHADAAHAEICAPAGEKPHSYRLQATVQSGRTVALLSLIQGR